MILIHTAKKFLMPFMHRRVDMKISENRLRQVVLEQISDNLLKRQIRHVIGEMQLSLSKEQQLIVEESVLDHLKSVSKKYGIPLVVLAKIAFGGEIASKVMDLDGVGVTPSAAEQIDNALETGQKMSKSRLDFLKKSIEDSSREGDIPADLEKGVTGDIAMDRLESEFVHQGEVESTGQAQAGVDGAQYLVYVPYDSLPDGYKDTFTGGAEKEDLKKFYQTMDIQDLADRVRDFNSWGSGGPGQFYDSDAGKLLPASWSIAYKALLDKHADRASKGKSLYKENT